MISLLIASLALQTPQTPAPVTPTGPTAIQLVSTMFARYDAAVTVVGSIRLTQTAANTSVVTSTDLQFVRPNKLYIKQVQQTATPKHALITADGRTFSYDRPAGVLRVQDRCVEAMRTAAGKLLDLADVYSAAVACLPDENAVLAVAISRKSDLRLLKSRLVGVGIAKTFKVGDETQYAVVGGWRESPDLPPTGRYEMDITADGDFRKFILVQSVPIPNHPEMEPLSVTSTWESSLKVDGQPNNALFTVVQ